MANTNWGTGIERVKGFSATVQLLLLNGVIYLAGNLIVNFFMPGVMGYLALPARIEDLGARFYTPLTYMFAHADLGHIFFNMIYLYFMGQIFASIVGEKRLWFTYIGGGLAGAALFILLANVLYTDNFPLLGASAAVTAVAVACAVYAPNMPVNVFIFGTFSLKWVVLILFLLNTVIDFSVNTGGKVAHLGGAFFGLAYAWQLRKGNDWMQIFSFKRKRIPAKVKKMQAEQKKIENEEKVLNDILDKINKSGYDSLTRSEKETLQKIAAKK